ncbi:hypothetical protein ACRTDO_09775 [Vibrio furnissii]|uniref:hypothetical protein n=1 Tax=Vibrio furnissii TaxID=29494 RepID=UPI003D7CF67E
MKDSGNTSKIREKSNLQTAKKLSDYSEKLEWTIMRSTLARSAFQTLRKVRNICSLSTLDNYLSKRGIPVNSNVVFESWDNASKQQQALVYHLTLQLNVVRSKSDDMVFPFTVRPLQSNETFYGASDKVLSTKFTDHFTKELKKVLGVDCPEYYYNITGKGSKRHIHGSVRLPVAFYDNEALTATEDAYNVLKRACGLTEQKRRQIMQGDKRGKEYKFAIAARNSTGYSNGKGASVDKPYGMMADFGCPEVDASYSQERWASYVISGNNKSQNKINRTKGLAAEAGRLNDLLHAALNDLRSRSTWDNDCSKLEKVITAWEQVMMDEVAPENTIIVTSENVPKTTSLSPVIDCDSELSKGMESSTKHVNAEHNAIDERYEDVK